MKSIETRTARALVLAIGVAVAALAYANVQGSAGGPAEALADQTQVRSSRASEVEAEIADSNLAAKLESGLGRTFGGVWFEPATAQVHVAVTSPAGSRRAAEIAAGAGMAGEVVAIPVRESWAQLTAAQARWSHRLADLFERGEVATWLAPETNSVGVELASSVTASRRASLERAAAADGVAVSVSVAPQSHLEVIPRSRCAAFAKSKAYCEPTIVAGQTIKGPSVKKSEVEEIEGEEEREFEELEGGNERRWCTAGPAALPVNRANPNDATKTYILTAGHCINEKKGGGGIGGKWEAYDKNGDPKGGHEVGAAVTYLDNITDVGVIEVNTTFWAKAKNQIPVVPSVAPWNQAAPEPVPVIQQLAPMLNAESCMAGQTSGLKCGKIVTLDQEISVKGVKIKNLIEVSGFPSQGGDSGGPFFSKAKFEEKVPTAYVEGTDVGTKGSTKSAVFQSLATSFTELNALKGLNLELLTQTNEKRHPKLKAGSYPVTLHGSGTGEKFTTEAGSIECKASTYDTIVEEKEKESSTLTVTPTYKECKASFLGVSATIEMEGCVYVYHMMEKASADNYSANMDISCPAGKSIKIAALTCKAEIKSQTERKSVDFVDDTSASPVKDITVRPTLTGITYIVTEDGALCPFSGTGEKTKGEYTSSEGVTLTGQSPVETTKKIAFEVADE